MAANQDLIEKMITSINNKLNLMEMIVNDHTIQLKVQLGIQEDRS